MENPWGKIILGGLAAAATWNSLGAERQRKAIQILEATLVTVEQVAIALGQQRQQLALLPVPELEPEPAPMPPLLSGSKRPCGNTSPNTNLPP